MNTGARFDIRAWLDLSAGLNLFFACIADKQYLEFEDNFPSTQRIISIDGQA